MTTKKTVTLCAPAIKVQQRPPSPTQTTDNGDFEPLHDFFVLTLTSDFLLQIAKFLGRHESSQGVQRKHKEDRDRQIGGFICSEHPFFPNTIIINIPLEYDDSFYDHDSMVLSVELDEASAYVIDGQHRLKAFKSPHSQGVTLPLVVSAYFGLQLPSIAEIFTRINFFQTPVSKSVVYDLLEFNKDPEFTRFREAHHICDKLNTTIGSPFYNLIKMLGIGTGLLSQAAFVEAVSTRYKIVPLLKKHLASDDIAQLISDYFKAIKESQPAKWGNSDSLLSRTVGFNALVKILMRIIEVDPSRKRQTYDFTAYAAAIRKIDVDSEDVKAFGGFKGVNALADKLASALGAEGLL